MLAGRAHTLRFPGVLWAWVLTKVRTPFSAFRLTKMPTAMTVTPTARPKAKLFAVVGIITEVVAFRPRATLTIVC